MCVCVLLSCALHSPAIFILPATLAFSHDFSGGFDNKRERSSSSSPPPIQLPARHKLPVRQRKSRCESMFYKIWFATVIKEDQTKRESVVKNDRLILKSIKVLWSRRIKRQLTIRSILTNVFHFPFLPGLWHILGKLPPDSFFFRPVEQLIKSPSIRCFSPSECFLTVNSRGRIKRNSPPDRKKTRNDRSLRV